MKLTLKRKIPERGYFKITSLIFFILMLSTKINWAQQVGYRKISGKVTDEKEQPLQAVSVTTGRPGQGTSTDGDGRYVLQIADTTTTIVFNSVGYQSLRLSIQPQQETLDAVLTASLGDLDEVVVVGYGTQRKSNLTGAISTVNSEILANRPVANAVEALQGTATGLTIQQNSSEPGSPLAINIRGLGTLGDASPLIMVDGVASSLDNLNPNDIDNVSVLKDAASAAIYGARAANGVILITTKKGSQNEKPQLQLSGMFGMQRPTRLPNPANSWEYAELRNEALVNSGMQPQFSPDEIRSFRENGPNSRWLADLFRNDALQQNYNASVSGGGEASSYFLSGGYVNQQNMFQGDGYGLKRYNFRANVRTDIGEKVSVGGVVGYSREDVNEHAYWTEWLIEPNTRIPPTYPIIDDDGNYVLGSGSSANSLARLMDGGNRKFSDDGLTGNLNAEWKITNDLKLGGLFGGDLKNNYMDEFRKSIDYAPYAGGGDNESSVTNMFSRTLLLNSQLTLNYNKQIGQHHVQGLAGFSQENNTYQIAQIRRIGIPGNDFGVISNGTTTDDNNTYGTKEEWSLQSYFGRANYNYADRYLLETNFRYDGSSRFADGRRFGFFPSVSAGWQLKNEPFLADITKPFDEIKLRASWGQLGNQNIGLYQYLSTVDRNTPAYSFNNQPATGAFFTVANNNITWETSSMLNIGVDGSLLDGRLTFDLDYFDKKTSNILLDLPVPDLFGGGSPLQNAGVVQNRGYEINLGWRQTLGNFSHRFNVLFSDNFNKVLDLRGQYYIYGFDVNTLVREGEPINSYFGYQTNGFFQNQAEVDAGPDPGFVNQAKPGDIRYVDQNGDGVINEEDRAIIGNPFPRYSFSFNYTANWRGFDIAVFVQGVGKRDVWIRGEATEAFHNNNEGPVMDFHLDRWTPSNPNASYPRLTLGSESANNAAKSDFWVQNAAYLRLKNLQFGYTIPSAWAQRIGLSNCRLYLTGQNLLTLTDLVAGYDPEVYSGASQSGRVYPVARVFSFGLNVNL